MTEAVVFTIYARYSSDLQNPHSCQDQIALILQDVRRRFPEWIRCAQYPHFTDNAETGRSVAHRSGFQEMIRVATSPNCPFNVILVEDLSRFARNREESIRYRRLLREHGVRVLSMADGYVDEENESGLWLLGIKEIKAEADSKEIGRRTKRGMAAKAREGYWCGGRPPFGYRRKPIYDPHRKDIDGNPLRIGVRLEIEPEEAKVVRLMFHLRAMRRMGYRRIARELCRRGIRNRNGQPFSQNVVRAMLKNPIYKGLLIWNRTKEVLTRDGRELKKRLPPEEWVKCEMPELAIVSEELWDAAQEVARERAGIAAGFCGQSNAGVSRPKQIALLRGIVRCAHCGRAFVVRRSDPKHRYYTCPGHRDLGTAFCNNRVWLRTDRLHNAVLDAIDKHLLSQEAVAFLQQKMVEFLEAYLREGRREVVALRRKEAQISRKIRRYVEAIGAGCDIEEVREELLRLKAEREETRRRVRVYEALQRRKEELLRRRIAEEAAKAARERLKTLEDEAELNAELRKHIKEILVWEDGRVEMVLQRTGLLGEETELCHMLIGAAEEADNVYMRRQFPIPQEKLFPANRHKR